MMTTFLSAVLVALEMGLAAQQVATPAPSASVSTYSEDVRCTGVLYTSQQRLKQRDPRQPAIQDTLLFLNDRLEKRVAAGEVDEATMVIAMQEAVNAAAAAPAEALETCLAAYPAPQPSSTE